MGATQSLKVAIKENDLNGVVEAIKNGADLYAKDKVRARERVYMSLVFESNESVLPLC